MIVRFFLAFAVALHRIATTLRIVAIEAETSQHHAACTKASVRVGVAQDAVIATRQLALDMEAQYRAANAKRWNVSARNARSAYILKSSVL